MSDFKGGWKPITATERSKTYAQWNGDRPVASEYMPLWPEELCTHYMLYETVTEGTPISPAFPSKEELEMWRDS